MSIKAKEIAKKLNLSPSAVSLALNGKPGISDKTRQLILKEAEKAGYITQKQYSVSNENIKFIIFRGFQDDIIQETVFYSYILQGIEKQAKLLGYNILVSYYNLNEGAPSATELISDDISGMIILGTNLSRPNLDKLSQVFRLNIPLVMVDNYFPELNIDCVVSDNCKGVYDAAIQLYNKGYNDIGYVMSKIRIDNFDLRLKGFKQAYKDMNISGDPTIIETGISSKQAFEDMNAWLNSGIKLPKALIADNDVIAAGCVRALKSHGLRIPDDIAILGYDNMPLCTLVEPSLSAIDVDKELMGKAAMTTLHNRINKYYGSDNGALLTYVSTKLIEREST